MAAQGAREVRLRIVCVEPPACEWEGARTEFGLQDRQRALHHGQTLADGSLAYVLTITAAQRPEADGVRFSGSFVHGTAADPFLYLSLRAMEGEPTAWVRRLKVPLVGLTWDRLVAAAEGGAFTIRVSGTRSGRAAVLGGGWTAGDAATDGPLVRIVLAEA